MWTKDQAGQIEAANDTLGREVKNSKALFSSSTCKFLLPLGTCFPRAWCCKSGLEPSPLTRENYCCLTRREQAWEGRSSQGRRPEQGLPFIWASRNPEGAQGVQPNPPQRATQRVWGQGAGTKSVALLGYLLCTSAGGHESCLASAAVKSTDSGAGAGLPCPNPASHCLLTPL